MDTNVQQGDWLIPHNCDEPHQIKEISYQEEPAGRWPIITFEGKGFWGVWYYPQNCKPLPLTPEILEKNGFIKDAQEDEKSVADVYYLLVPTGFESKSFTIQVSLYKVPICGVITLVKCWGWVPPYNGGLNDIHLCSANYVHQLQHALRLCGIEKEIEL